MKYEPMNIKVIAKYTLGYFILIETVGILISLLILFTDYIRQIFPDMPAWILPIVLSIVFVLIGAKVWHRLSETDVLKYEFISVITHKFRTPLTRIKWAAEDVASVVPLPKKEDIDTILESERQLLALTDTLVHLSAADISSLNYHPSPINTESLFHDLSNQYSIRAEKKGINLSFSASPLMFIMVDAEKSSFIFQILLDNALNYTPAGGSITVRAWPDSNGKYGTIEIADNGIGMSRETASRVFRRFYRGDNARHADTEGMGIGLFMAKNIVEKQNGKISMKSEGEGKGSTFYIHLPLYKNSAKHI
jgi:signal transduction histidine kinase